MRRESCAPVARPVRSDLQPSRITSPVVRFFVGEKGPWVDGQRERLRGILVRALECRGEVFLWNREILLAIEAAKEAIALEPFRETAHQLLIRAHAALGNAADAKRAYHHCREILAARLGIEPSSQTEHVYQSALGGGPAGATAIDGPATVAPQTLRPSGDLRADLQRLLGDVYRIDEELGGGGMSRVFLAEERALGRQVVLKVLSPDKAETFSADRFAREVRLAAKLQQANIVPLLSAAVAGGIPVLHDAVHLRAVTARGVVARDRAVDPERNLDPAGRGARAGICAHARHRAPRHQAGKHSAVWSNRCCHRLRDCQGG